MVEPVGSSDRESAAPGEGAAASRAPENSGALWLRIGLLSLVAVATIAGIVAFSYQLALARVPQHRATLERLVRARTGLDVRFNELGVRWGWYGPEAVFRRVELGEPGNPAVLLRTSELVVGFDAWRTMQTGQLEVGRITFVAPEIDLTRSRPTPVRGVARVVAEPHRTSKASKTDVFTVDGRAQWLKRWPRGRIDIENGTLRLPAPNGSSDSLALQVKTASLRRTDETWNATAQIFLPDRLGRTARATLRLKGDADQAASLAGAIVVEGRRLAFNGWRDVLLDRWGGAQFIPSAGNGDFSITLSMNKGKFASAQGAIHADEVSFRRPALQVAVLSDERAPLPSQMAGRVLRLGYLRGDWKVWRRENEWRVELSQLAVGPRGRETPPTSLKASIAPSGAVKAKMASAPVDFLASATQWFATDLDWSDTRFQGRARDIAVDWTPGNEPGHRLQIDTKIEDFGFGSRSQGWELSGLRAHLTGDEGNLIADVESTDGTLNRPLAEGSALEEIAIAGRLQLQRSDAGWSLSTEKLAADHRGGKLQVSGAWRLAEANSAPSLDLQATLDGVDVSLVRTLLGNQTLAFFGPTASRLAGGKIERAYITFAGDIGGAKGAELQDASKRAGLEDRGGGAGAELQNAGRAEAEAFASASRVALAREFRGSLTLRDGALTADGAWPAIKGFDAQLDWKGPSFQARVDRGSGGPFELTSLTASWRLDGKQTVHVAAQGRGRIESVLDWLRKHPELSAYAPNTEMLAASGSALFNFTASLPGGAERVRKRAPQVRVTASLDGAAVQLIPQFPRVEAVRGTLAFDSGRLQRSALTASWLGGPVTMRFSEHLERGVSGVLVQAQGTFDAEQLLAAARFAPATRVSGRTPWKAEFAFVPGSPKQSPAWHARIDSTLIGVTSELPAPLEKAGDVARPLRIDLAGNERQVEARFALGAGIQSIFRLDPAERGAWKLARGALSFGGEAAELPEQRGIELQGRIERLDLSSWLAAARQLPVDDNPIRVDLYVNEMLVAGRSYEDARLNALHNQDGLTLQVDSSSLAGNLSLPSGDETAEAASLRLTRLDVPEAHSAIEMGPILAALGRNADISAENFSWRSRPLGSLSAKVHAGEGGVSIESIKLESAFHDATASLICKFVSAPCRMQFELQSNDASATLREFGFRDELTAADAKVSGELEWPLLSQKPWLESVQGQVKLALADGMTRSSVDTEGRPFPLFAVPALLRQSAVQSNQDGVAGVAMAAGATPRLKFAQLEADFELKDGSARTANLHFDGDAEILMRGRTGFIDRDYDYAAWVLRGEDRLPAAVRRFGASPRVAAAWMALRDFISGPNTDRASAVLHLGGTWDAPMIGPVQ